MQELKTKVYVYVRLGIIDQNWRKTPGGGIVVHGWLRSGHGFVFVNVDVQLDVVQGLVQFVMGNAWRLLFLYLFVPLLLSFRLL